MLPDLVSADRVAASLELSEWQLALVPSLVTSASRAIRRFTKRVLTAATYSESYAPPQDGRILLREYPLGGSVRVSVARTPALRVANTDLVGNQLAGFAFAVAGDLDLGLTPAGLSLSWTSGGTAQTAPIPFAAGATVAAVAALINAVGSGWTATPFGGFGPWPAAELVGADCTQAALGPPGATLDVFAQDLAGCRIDRRAGILTLPIGPGPAMGYGAGLGFVPSYGWPGDPFYADEGDDLGDCAGQVRVLYDAGYSVVPEDIQEYAVELVQAMFARLAANPTLKAEAIKDNSWQYRDAFEALPEHVRDGLAPYVRRD